MNMYIQGTSNVHSAQPLRAPHRAAGPATSAGISHSHGADELDISSEADFVSQARDLPEIRHDRVAEIRAQIASGKYETAEKLDLALERLLDEIG
jgi:negative regulator of flagellin synthesis FlgM